MPLVWDRRDKHGPQKIVSYSAYSSTVLNTGNPIGSRLIIFINTGNPIGSCLMIFINTGNPIGQLYRFLSNDFYKYR